VTACPECGVDPSTMSPGDALATARSLPRRWRGAFARAGDDDEGRALLARRPPGDGPSALERAGRTVSLLDRWDERIREALVREHPSLSPDDPTAVSPGEPGLALERLSASAEALAGTLGGVASGDWGRTADLGGREVTVLGMAQEAAHAGSHHLRAVERILRELTGKG
jgi:hypothetical protein